MTDNAKASSRLKKGAGIVLAIAAVIILTLLTGWAGMRYPEHLFAFRHRMENHQSLWLVWRLSLYTLLGWGSRKIFQATQHKPAYRTPLIRMMTASLLFILLCEYALSGSMGGSA
ncbi:hypothetical protein [Xenorhabdus bovienii]|uniref:hypothetical protein n=1 Tax=Xenorhabdus bovienii TaxID=40576 RepID=UPI0004D9C5CA|nr:hypothetical protein [Xenorhabdus bovienii]CDG90213.1 putative exported protein [Xenorhabdus bovienii str. feltiae France]CDG93925.1 putative exported protein [Xenorhabdus bovienii str. feltiae Florida]